MSKYFSKKTEVDGIVFDSKKEALRYEELRMLEKAGMISDLQLQVPFELIPGFRYNGQAIRAVKYIADFVYFDGGRTIVEDVKPSATYQTDVYKIKKKLLLYKYAEWIDFREVY